MSPEWVVFDYGEVLCHATAALPDMAAELDVDAEAFTAAYWGEREAYDRGCADLEYWSAVGRRVGVDVDDALARRLTGMDAEGWLQLDDASMALVRQLADAGVPLALLSNAPSSFGRAVERQEWTTSFRHLLFSGDLKVAKPDEAIYTTLVDRLGTDPRSCLFFDDRQVNIDGARAAGLQAELWESAAAAITHLERHQLLARART